MKKADIKVGEEYAYCRSTGSWDRHRSVLVKVIEERRGSSHIYGRREEQAGWWVRVLADERLDKGQEFWCGSRNLIASAEEERRVRAARRATAVLREAKIMELDKCVEVLGGARREYLLQLTLAEAQALVERLK